MPERLKDAELLVKYGFIKESALKNYKLDEKKGHYVFSHEKTGDSESYNHEHADEEYEEEANISLGNQYYPTGFPRPVRRFKLVYEAFNMSMEELYYWSINHIRQDTGFPNMVKITDIFSASENSAFFGQSAQRLAIQEDRASGFLRTIGEMVKTLFQIVRELRIIDERLDIYHNWKKSKSADSTLKGLFADFAENKGGQMQPGSIFHLSNQVGYATLPDLFFNTTIYDKEKIDEIVDSLGFNKNVKSVLKRKLYQFIVWKEKTQEELEARRKFQIKYLRQHYTVIKTYISWVKPYLKHIKRLTMNEEQLDSPELIGSFETSATEIEVLAYKPNKGNACNSCVLMTFKFNTRPVMQYRQEYQQGPVHIGKGVMTLRSYAWTDEEIRMYRKMRDAEDRELLGLADDQLQSAMNMLGTDLEKYLDEAEKSMEEKQESEGSGAPGKKEKLTKLGSDDNVFEPFVSLAKGFGEIGKAFIPIPSKKHKKPAAQKKDAKKAVKEANGAMWLVYKNYKKAHGLLSW